MVKGFIASKPALAPVAPFTPPLVSKPSEPPKSPDVVTDLEASDIVVDDTVAYSITSLANPVNAIPPLSPPPKPKVDVDKTEPYVKVSEEKDAEVKKIPKPEIASVKKPESKPKEAPKIDSITNDIDVLRKKTYALIDVKTYLIEKEVYNKEHLEKAKESWMIIKKKIETINDIEVLKKIILNVLKP